MKLKSILVSLVIFQSILCRSAAARAKNSRAATAAPYLDRDAVWVSRGKLDQAIADFDLAIASFLTRSIKLRSVLDQ